MRLAALEFLERGQVRIRVVEADDEADRDLVVLEVVEERAAVGRRCRAASRRCARRGPGWCLRRVDLPQLLDADAVALRVARRRRA